MTNRSEDKARDLPEGHYAQIRKVTSPTHPGGQMDSQTKELSSSPQKPFRWVRVKFSRMQTLLICCLFPAAIARVSLHEPCFRYYQEETTFTGPHPAADNRTYYDPYTGQPASRSPANQLGQSGGPAANQLGESGGSAANQHGESGGPAASFSPNYRQTLPMVNSMTCDRQTALWNVSLAVTCIIANDNVRECCPAGL